jgi:hypothetical protein
MAESGLIEPSSNGTNLTIQQVKRRDLVRSRNIIQQFFNKKSAYSVIIIFFLPIKP